MRLSELIDKLNDLRKKCGNVEVSIYFESETTFEWCKLTNIYKSDGNEEEMISDYIVIECEPE